MRKADELLFGHYASVVTVPYRPLLLELAAAESLEMVHYHIAGIGRVFDCAHAIHEIGQPAPGSLLTIMDLHVAVKLPRIVRR